MFLATTATVAESRSRGVELVDTRADARSRDRRSVRRSACWRRLAASPRRGSSPRQARRLHATGERTYPRRRRRGCRSVATGCVRACASRDATVVCRALSMERRVTSCVTVAVTATRAAAAKPTAHTRHPAASAPVRATARPATRKRDDRRLDALGDTRPQIAARRELRQIRRVDAQATQVGEQRTALAALQRVRLHRGARRLRRRRARENPPTCRRTGRR